MLEKIPSFENNPEKEPEIKTVITDFIRHGESKYREVLMSDEERSELGNKRPLDLTDKGVEQVKQTAMELVKTINKDEEVVMLWTSPAWRARGSADLIREVLEKEGITVLREDVITSMRPIKQKDAGYMAGVWGRVNKEGLNGDAVFARHPEFQVPNDKVESYPEAKQRAERVYNWIRYIAEKIDTNGKRLHIIGTTHFEFLNPIMEELFGFDVEKDEGVSKGEPMRITFEFDKNAGETRVSADFRGQHKEALTFDAENRRFVSK